MSHRRRSPPSGGCGYLVVPQFNKAFREVSPYCDDGPSSIQSAGASLPCRPPPDQQPLFSVYQTNLDFKAPISASNPRTVLLVLPYYGSDSLRTDTAASLCISQILSESLIVFCIFLPIAAFALRHGKLFFGIEDSGSSIQFIAEVRTCLQSLGLFPYVVLSHPIHSMP